MRLMHIYYYCYARNEFKVGGPQFARGFEGIGGGTPCFEGS